MDELEQKERDGEIEPLDEIDQLLLCLPDIAESVAGRQPLFEDFKGWTMLRDMFHKWFSGPANTEAKFYPEPYWVDWDWVMSYARARQAYEEMIASVGGIPYILSEKARTVLGGILREQNCLTSGKKYFDFIDMAGTDWQKWESWYHQHKRVGLGKPHIDDEGPIPDGLAVCLAGFTLRALARGWTEPNLEGGHSIHVSQVAVFVHDIFNFEDSGRWWTLDGELFFWNCEERSFSLNPLNRIPPSKWRYLDDGDLNDFRDRYGVGGDFLVLSQPHLVENFVPIRYDYIIKS